MRVYFNIVNYIGMIVYEFSMLEFYRKTLYNSLSLWLTAYTV